MVQKNMYESMDASLLKPKDGYRSFISKRVGNVAFKCNISLSIINTSHFVPRSVCCDMVTLLIKKRAAKRSFDASCKILPSYYEYFPSE